MDVLTEQMTLTAKKSYSILQFGLMAGWDKQRNVEMICAENADTFLKYKQTAGFCKVPSSDDLLQYRSHRINQQTK